MWPLGFVVPAYQMLDQPFYGIGLKVYDMLAGNLKLAGSRWLNHRETLAAAPTLAEHVGGRPLRGGNLYFDGQFDDARLAIALMRTLFDVGGTAVNYLRVTGLLQQGGAVTGVTVQDALGEACFALQAKCVINATGVWVDAVRRMEDGGPAPWWRPAGRAPDAAAQLPARPGRHPDPAHRRRPGTVRGALERPHHRRHHRHPAPGPAARTARRRRRRRLHHGNGGARYLSRSPTRADVTSVWAGLRPLVKATGKTPPHRCRASTPSWSPRAV